jgi:hypothetical protein
VTTATFILTSIAVMFFNYREEQSVIVTAGIWLSLALTLISSADYVFRMRRLIGEPVANGQVGR